MDAKHYQVFLNILSSSLHMQENNVEESIKPDNMWSLMLIYLARLQLCKSLEYQFSVIRNSISYISDQVVPQTIVILGREFIKL